MSQGDGYYRVIFEDLGNKYPDETPLVLRLIELEDKNGKGIAGKWVDTDDGSGTIELHIPAHPALSEMYEALKNLVKAIDVMDDVGWYNEEGKLVGKAQAALALYEYLVGGG